MDIHIHIDDRVARPLRWVLRRRVVCALAVIGMLISTGALNASPVADFQAGDVISSSQMNTVLNGLSERITTLEAGAPVRGYERVEREILSSAWERLVVTVQCPAGKRPTSGGYFTSATINHVDANYPYGNDSWKFILSRGDGPDLNIWFFAVCIEAT